MKGLRLFPNPVNEILNLYSEYETFTIEIFDKSVKKYLRLRI